MRNTYKPTFILFIFTLLVIFALFFVLFFKTVGAESPNLFYLPVVTKNLITPKIHISPDQGVYGLGFPDMVASVEMPAGKFCYAVWMEFNLDPKASYTEYHNECYCGDKGYYAIVLLSIYSPTTLTNLKISVDDMNGIKTYPQEGTWMFQ